MEKIKDIALENINDFQGAFDSAKKDIEFLKKELEKDNWTIDFNHYDFVDDVLSDRENDVIYCRATKFVEDDKRIVIEKKAKCSDDDVYLEILGKLLSLAKVYSVIKE